MVRPMVSQISGTLTTVASRLPSCWTASRCWLQEGIRGILRSAWRALSTVPATTTSPDSMTSSRARATCGSNWRPAWARISSRIHARGPARGAGPAVGPVAGHRLEGIAGMDDAGFNGNALAAEPIRVAGAVPSLVLRADDRSDPRQERNRGHDPFTDHGMLSHDGRFLVIEGPRLVQDVSGHADLPDVVKQRAVLQKTQGLRLQPEAAPARLGERRGLPRVRLRVAVLGVEGGRQRGDRR